VQKNKTCYRRKEKQEKKKTETVKRKVKSTTINFKGSRRRLSKII